MLNFGEAIAVSLSKSEKAAKPGRGLGAEQKLQYAALTSTTSVKVMK